MNEQGLRFVGTVIALSSMIGFFFTVGMWAFCKTFRWSPVNISVTTNVHSDDVEVR